MNYFIERRNEMSQVENRLSELGIEIPEPPRPLGNFAPYLIDGDYLYISGQISVDVAGNIQRGKLGQSATIEQGVEAARHCAIGLLARAKAALGDLDRIEKLLKLGAFVNAVPEFADHPKVVNGASDFMVEVFGSEVAEHVRFAVGSSSLPGNAMVEIEAVFRISAT
ncbi:RidA family protein [Sulfitobacter pacificus]